MLLRYEPSPPAAWRSENELSVTVSQATQKTGGGERAGYINYRRRHNLHTVSVVEGRQVVARSPVEVMQTDHIGETGQGADGEIPDSAIKARVRLLEERTCRVGRRNQRYDNDPECVHLAWSLGPTLPSDLLTLSE